MPNILRISSLKNHNTVICNEIMAFPVPPPMCVGFFFLVKTQHFCSIPKQLNFTCCVNHFSLEWKCYYTSVLTDDCDLKYFVVWTYQSVNASLPERFCMPPKDLRTSPAFQRLMELFWAYAVADIRYCVCVCVCVCVCTCVRACTCACAHLHEL